MGHEPLFRRATPANGNGALSASLLLCQPQMTLEAGTQPRIALLLQVLNRGGAERVMLTLAEGLIKKGCRVDFLLVVKRGEFLADVPEGARLIELGTVSRWRLVPWLFRLPWRTLKHLPGVLIRNRQPKIVRSLPRLIRYLQNTRPNALLTTLPNNNLVALWADFLCRQRGGADTRIVVREANTTSMEVAHLAHPFESKLPIFMRQWYPRADAVIAVSDSVREDLSTLAALPRRRITTIYNPIELGRVRRLAATDIASAWFEPDAPPVILAVGRLAPQKDYPTLLRSFARVRARRQVRLVILGEGGERAGLEELATRLGVAADLQMPGAVANPYAFMARAVLLVLSSAWEGFPNVLLEALACGCPIVSTDCPSGPSEILDGGAFGSLVPVADDEALAQAVIGALASPPDRERLRRRAQMFSVDVAVDRYLEALLGDLRIIKTA